MRNKKLVTLLSSVCLIVILAAMPFMGACAPEEEVTPLPEEKPTPEQHEPVTVEIYTPPKGFTIYLISFAAAEVINKHSTWLKASAVETLGGPDALRTMRALPPERRKNAITYQQDLEWPRSTMAILPYKERFTDLRQLCAGWEQGNIHYALTLDPNIKTYKDLIGKKVGTTSEAGGFGLFTRFLMRDCWGILDKVKLEVSAFGGLKEALLSGVIDAAWMPTIIAPRGKFTASPITLSIITAKPTYFIPISKEDVEKGNAKTYYDAFWENMPKGALGHGVPHRDVGVAYNMNIWYCWKEADPEVIYEICRIFYEYGHELDEALPALKGFAKNPEIIGYNPYLAEDVMHPGAVEYFKEKGIKIGGK